MPRVERKCQFCNKIFRVYTCKNRPTEGRFCCSKCYWDSMRTLDRNRKCSTCGKHIKYSSKYCVKHSQLGNRGPNWQGGKTPKSKLERNRLWGLRWSKTIYERDGWNCQICGKHGGDLHAHHRLSFKDFPELRFDVSNGVTLCIPCHKKIHYERFQEIYRNRPVSKLQECKVAV